MSSMISIYELCNILSINLKCFFLNILQVPRSSSRSESTASLTLSTSTTVAPCSLDCRSGGLCVDDKHEQRCQCPLGKTGKLCEEGNVFSLLTLLQSINKKTVLKSFFVVLLLFTKVIFHVDINFILEVRIIK